MTTLHPDNVKTVLPFQFDAYKMGTALMDECERVADEYMGGGTWTIFPAKDGTDLFFAVPPSGNYTVDSASNYYSGAMDSMTLGASVTLMVFNRLLWDAHSHGHDIDDATERFYALKDALLDNPLVDSGELLSYID